MEKLTHTVYNRSQLNIGKQMVKLIMNWIAEKGQRERLKGQHLVRVKLYVDVMESYAHPRMENVCHISKKMK